jgi:hypothetical protein
VSAELAAVVLSFNEERHIGACLDSLAWADRRVVVDSFSTDQTVEIARRHGADVIQRAFSDFASQRNAALDAVDATWVLFVDADERTTPALAGEIRRVIAGGRCAGWWIPRHNYLVGHRMRGGGWYPDPQLRLLRRGRARYDPALPVHERVILDGPEGTLDNVLIHYNYDSVRQFLRKQDRYVDYEVRILDERGVRVRPWTYVSMPLREFWRRLVTLGGWRDHVYGLLFSTLLAYYKFVAYARLRRLRRAASA